MLNHPQSLSTMSMQALKKSAPQSLHDIIQTTFTGQKLDLPLDELFRLIAQVQRSQDILNKTHLIQYGLMTTLIEEVEKLITKLEPAEQTDHREKLYQALNDDPLPLPSIKEMLTYEGTHVCAVGTSNLNNSTYNLMLRPTLAKKYALIFDCDLHHPGIAKMDKTLPLLNPSIQKGVFLWIKNDATSFYQRQPVNVFGEESQVVQYQENNLNVFIERNFDPKILTDKSRLTISVSGLSENQLNQAQKTIKHALFRLGLGAITYPQRPIDRERARIFTANRAKHQKNQAGRLLSYDQERDLQNYDLSLEDLKKVLAYDASKVAQTYEEEVMPGRTAWVHDELETKIKRNIAPFLYHEILQLKYLSRDNIEARIKAILSHGLCSTAHRFRHGEAIEGLSSKSDLESGSGNSVFTRVCKSEDTDLFEESGIDCAFILDTHSTRQVSTYMYSKDSYGIKDKELYPSRKAPYELTEDKELKYKNELMIKYAIPLNSIIGIFMKPKIYTLLKAEVDRAVNDSGILTLTGKTLAEFIVHSTQDANAMVKNHEFKSYSNTLVYKKNIEKNAKRQYAPHFQAQDPNLHIAKKIKLYK